MKNDKDFVSVIDIINGLVALGYYSNKKDVSVTKGDFAIELYLAKYWLLRSNKDFDEDPMMAYNGVVEEEDSLSKFEIIDKEVDRAINLLGNPGSSLEIDSAIVHLVEAKFRLEIVINEFNHLRNEKK